MSEEKPMNKHQRLARGENPYPHVPAGDQDFGCTVSKPACTYESVGNTERRKEDHYGAGDTKHGPGR